ncbi:MAG: branched-chain amino acid ABC transporter permease [Dehalococcoidia bacterium]|jgi:branched-chain amino acid transport system permease protein
MTVNRNNNWLKWAVPLAVILLLALLPAASPDIFYLSIGVILFMYVALASSWNIIGGYSGYISFGHGAFFGIGAYVVAMLLIKFGYSPFLTCFLGGILSALFALIVGYPVLRLKGPYFSIATLCLGLAVPVLVNNLPEALTGGGEGLFLPLMKIDIFFNRTIYYEVMLFLAVGTTLLARWILNSKFGLGLNAIRENENTAETIGVNSTVLKLQAFVFSAFLVGVIGGIYAYYRTYVDTATVFDPNLSIAIVMMAIFGGAATWQGPLIGALILTLIDQVLISAFPGAPAEISRLIYGLILVLVIMFMPSGIMHFLLNKFKHSSSPETANEVT